MVSMFWLCYWYCCYCYCWLQACVIVVVGQVKNINSLYDILGVSRSASTQEIKRAYRKKALDTHPDKNRNIPPEEAAESFRQVVQAFEILSDSDSRRRYDRTGRTTSNNDDDPYQGSQQQRQQQGFQFNFNFNQFFYQGQQQRQYRPKLQDQPIVKQAQARLMHIVSWEQFQTVLLDDDTNTKLDRHVLLVALTPKFETLVMDEMVFPYPFAGMSSQHIWWEDVLQTVMIRYHNQNELTKILGLPKGQDMIQPIFLFGKQGQTITSPQEEDDDTTSSSKTSTAWSRLETTDRTKLETWVWQQIQVEIRFVNYHDHAVEIYWIHGTRAHIKIPHLESGHISEPHYSHLTHEWYIRDARVDKRRDSPGRYKLSNDSMLITYQIINPKSPQSLIIPLRTCFDLSGHCGFWKVQGECTKNPNFMRDQCQLSCQFCSDEQDKRHVEQAKQGTYTPPGQQQQQQQHHHQQQESDQRDEL